MFAQVISADGQCLSRDMDGSQYIFKPGPEDTFELIGVAALGPKLDENALPIPALPPALNPEELLAPLPPEVKVQRMNAEAEKKRRSKKPGTPKFAYIFNVTNALGDVAEVEMKVREDLKPGFYNAGACMKAGTVIPNVKPFKVLGWRRKES